MFDLAPDVLNSCIGISFDTIRDRVLAGRRGCNSGPTQIVVSFEKILPNVFMKLKIDIQAYRDDISVLEPVWRVDRAVYSDARAQMVHHGARFILWFVYRRKIVDHPILLQFGIRKHVLVGAIEKVNILISLDLKQP